MFDVCRWPSCRASVLVGLLWCVALLSVVVVGVLHTSWMDLVMVKNFGDRVQAHYLALAGIEKAEALLYQNALDRSRSDTSHDGAMYDDPRDFRDVPFGRGQFSVLRRGRQDEGGGIFYGVSDEESRLNVNIATTNEMEKLENLTPAVAAAVVNWREPATAAIPSGATAAYYESLQPPYRPRNGPFETVRELLMVRGVTRRLLLGNDTHQDGFLSDGEADESGGGGDHACDVDAGWAGLVTVDSSVDNVSASGRQRVNVQSASEAELTDVRGITPEIARAIVAYRGQHRFQSIADLLDVTAPQPQQRPASQRGGVPGQANASPPSAGGSQPEPSGPKVISAQLLMDIADGVTTSSSRQLPGVININTAGLDVLACLPGVDRELAQAIISYRQSSGFFPNIAWLLKVPGVTTDIFKQVAPLITARSDTYRILCEGRIHSTGVRQRIQVIVHVGLNDVTTLSYREDDL